MNDLVTFSRALADPTRSRIVNLVMKDALCVCELAEILGMPQSSVSSHVQIIRKAGLLDSEKCEKWTYFRIAPEYRKLIKSLMVFFVVAETREFEKDTAKAAKRLAQREVSCCAGPKRLTNCKHATS